jgi:TonB family protein
MTSNEGQPTGTETRDTYEATVLEFLDKEMATVQAAQKKSQQTDELDALVTDLLKQVITEADQTQPADKPLFDEDELFAGLHASPAAAGTERAATIDQAPDSVPAPSSASLPQAAETAKTVAKPEPKPEISKAKPAPAAVFAPSHEPRRNNSVMAAAAAGLIVLIALAYFFFSGPSRKTSNSGAQATVAQPADMRTPSNAETRAVKPATSAAANAKSSPAATLKKSMSAKAAVSAVPIKPQPVAGQQAGTPAPAKGQFEPSPQVIAKGPAEERLIMAQSAPVTPLSAPIAATIEKPAASPGTERAASAAPQVPDGRSIPSPQPANTISESPAPATPSASSALPPNGLVSAVPIAQMSPAYPEVALRSRASGSVILELQIDDQGKVAKATPVSGPAIFYNAAVNAAMKWRYRPASINGVNVSSQSRVTMVFNLKK